MNAILGHASFEFLADQYKFEVNRLVDYMINTRPELRTADEADDCLFDAIMQSAWVADERMSALALAFAEVPNAADAICEWDDIDFDHPHAQRAGLALQLDVLRKLWDYGWKSIGEQFRSIDFKSVMHEHTPRLQKRTSAVDDVLKYGYEVCDQLEVYKQNALLTDPRETAEMKLFRALERLKRSVGEQAVK